MRLICIFGDAFEVLNMEGGASLVNNVIEPSMAFCLILLKVKSLTIVIYLASGHLL
jgi:hypothetical protein